MRLSRNFQLAEFPCWERASSAEIAQLRELVATVLQPVRDRFGPVVPTSWRWWRTGCVPRTGAHSRGAVDFVVPGQSLREVVLWIARELPGTFGVVIDEGDHVHVTPPGVGEGKALALLSNGEFVELELEYPGAPPRGDRPLNAGGAAVALLVLFLLLRSRSGA